MILLLQLEELKWEEPEAFHDKKLLIEKLLMDKKR